MGVNSKVQTQQIYDNPQAYPLHLSDPSFKIYPNV
jgi:hypothetical protein